MRLSGRAAQFNVMNAWSVRALAFCMALAKISLPVPVSPCNKTVTSVAATILALRIKDSNAGDWPMIELK